MADLPKIEDPAFMSALKEWTEAKREAEYWKLKEMELRLRLFGAAFVAPVEGTNKAALPHDWIFKATHKINRTIDKAALPAAREQLREINVNPDELVKYEPDLVVSAYKRLSDQARTIFDTCLTIKPGAPTLELIAPKASKE